MNFLVISYALLAFVLVSVILSPIGFKDDERDKRIKKIRNVDEKAAFGELNQSFFQRFISPAVGKLKKVAAKAMPKKKNRNTKDNKSEKVARQLRLAGMHNDPEEFQFVQNIIMILSMALGVVLFLVFKDQQILIRLLILAGCALLGIAGPTFYLSTRVTSHQEGIRKQLPDAMDLLGVCIEAGLSFDSSLLKISEKLKGPFIDELMIVYREIQMGRPRREALQDLANNSSIPELKTFASALSQAEELGIPINNVMKVQSEQLRVTRRQQAQEKGQKATIKMLLPMLLFIFPVVFIILLGPTVMNIMNTF